MPDPLHHLIAETMADSLGGVQADVYEATAAEVLEAIAEAGYRIDRAGAIVKALAECEVPLSDWIDCDLCPSDYRDANPDQGGEWWSEPTNHSPACPWRMAREAVGDE